MLDVDYCEKRRDALAGVLARFREMGYDFRQFGREHCDLYLKYEPQTELSCRCLLSQYTYAEEDCIHLWEDEAGQCLYMIFLNPNNELRAYPPMLAEYSPERFADAVEKFRRMFEAVAVPLRFEYASGTDVERFSKLPCAIEVCSPEAEMDYIYAFASLMDFSGGKNANRRRKYNHFISRSQAALERIHAGNIADCAAVLDEWCAKRSCGECGHRCPRNMGKRALAELDRLHAMGFLMRVNGEAQALILLGYMSPDMLDVLTICSVSREMGMEEALYAMVADAVPPAYTWMNLEEDMGLEGLRSHKQALHPHRMGPKYSILLS